MSKLTAKQARAWADAELEVSRARAALKLLEIDAKAMRSRYADKLAPSDLPEDDGKNITTVTAGGVCIRVATFEAGEGFSLAKYLDAGHPLTAEMSSFVSPATTRTRVTVQDFRNIDR